MNTIQSEWEKFSKAVIPSDASEPQVHDMRMSFFFRVKYLPRYNPIWCSRPE